MIVFPCAGCGQKLQVPDTFAGKPVRCSLCKHVMNGPAPVAIAVAATVPVPEVAGNPSSLAQAGLNGGVTLGATDSSQAEQNEKATASRRSLREALSRGLSGCERYRVLNEIARGGMGAVLRAADCDIRREVAVKYLLDQADERKKARFVEEAQITGQLEHPNIVPVHELGLDAKKRLFFSMKMVRGRSLQQVFNELREEPRSAEKEYTLTRLLSILVNVCHALGYAHSRGVVHRDLKPANIMIGDFGEVYVMDWGLAKVLGREGPKERPSAVIQAAATPSFAWAEAQGHASATVKTSRQTGNDQTMDGTILGTPLYMPPEQAVGNITAVDQRSDIYSLGAILYEMLTLLPPVEPEGGHMAILMRVSQGEIVPPAERAPKRARSGKVPKELAAVAMKALAKMPDQRYPEVSELRRDIELFLEGRAVSAKEDTKWEATVKLVRRNRAFSMAAATALVVIGVVLIGSAVVNYKARVRAEEAHTAYLQEQEDKRAQARKSVPAFVEAAHAAVERKKFSDALAQVDVALEFDPDYAPAHLLKGQLFIARKDFATARQELERYLKSQPDDAQAAKLARLCATIKPDDPGALTDVADILIRQQVSTLAMGLLQAPEKLREIHRLKIEKAWPGLGQFLNMDGEGRLSLVLNQCPQVLDLLPLKDLPLRSLALYHNAQVRDLAPLKGMPLTQFDLQNCFRVTDVTPLKGMKLTSLVLNGWGDTADFSVLKGMPLTTLTLASIRFGDRDLRLLRDAPLTQLTLTSCAELTNLNELKGKPITNLQLSTLPKLKDLTALKGMPLTNLTLANCGSISDLKPLQGLPITQLQLNNCTQIKDITPLRGMPVTWLDISNCTLVEDLTPLAGMRLTALGMTNCPEVADLAPLKDMPLHSLNLQGCRRIKDLTPLRGMELWDLRLSPQCDKITDLTPLEDVKLAAIWFDPRTVKKGLDVVRKMKKLARINDLLPEEFWKQYDAGAFTK